MRSMASRTRNTSLAAACLKRRRRSPRSWASPASTSADDSGMRLPPHAAHVALCAPKRSHSATSGGSYSARSTLNRSQEVAGSAFVPKPMSRSRAAAARKAGSCNSCVHRGCRPNWRARSAARRADAVAERRVFHGAFRAEGKEQRRRVEHRAQGCEPLAIRIRGPEVTQDRERPVRQQHRRRPFFPCLEELDQRC